MISEPTAIKLFPHLGASALSGLGFTALPQCRQTTSPVFITLPQFLQMLDVAIFSP
jgi:hypothetical protein